MRTVKIVNDKDLKVIDAIRTRTDRSAKNPLDDGYAGRPGRGETTGSC